jgi:hypothetical protein
MKLLLSLLVVANVLAFGWFRGWMAPFGGDGREPQRHLRQVEPQQLRVLSPSGDSTGAGSGAAPGAATGGSAVPPTAAAAGGGGPESEPAAPAAPAALRAANCAEIGPMSEADAVRVQVALDAVAPELVIATRRLDETTSWWVYLAPSQVELSKRLADLRERGVTDTYVMPDGLWRGAISLGLFRQEDLAVALQRNLSQKGLRNVRVAPRGPAPGRVALQVRPVGDAVLAELPKLRAAMPEAVARACVARS